MGYMSLVEKQQADAQVEEYLAAKKRAERKETLYSLRYMRLYRKTLEKF